jgi:hypothetical protein
MKGGLDNLMYNTKILLCFFLPPCGATNLKFEKQKVEVAGGFQKPKVAVILKEKNVRFDIQQGISCRATCQRARKYWKISTGNTPCGS